MTTIVQAVTKINEHALGGPGAIILFETLTETNADGAPIDTSLHEVESVQGIGDFGTSGAITLQGSNDGTNYSTLNDEAGNACTITAAGFINHPNTTPRYIRPFISAGTSVDVDVRFLVRPRVRES